jgi:hypothetical protein
LAIALQLQEAQVVAQLGNIEDREKSRYIGRKHNVQVLEHVKLLSQIHDVPEEVNSAE